MSIASVQALTGAQMLTARPTRVCGASAGRLYSTPGAGGSFALCTSGVCGVRFAAAAGVAAPSEDWARAQDAFEIDTSAAHIATQRMIRPTLLFMCEQRFDETMMPPREMQSA